MIRADEMSVLHREMLEFESHWFRYVGSKEQQIRQRFQMSATRYYQVLNRVIDDPRAMFVDPVLVGRLRRLRHSRCEARYETALSCASTLRSN